MLTSLHLFPELARPTELLVIKVTLIATPLALASHVATKTEIMPSIKPMAVDYHRVVASSLEVVRPYCVVMTAISTIAYSLVSSYS